MLYNSLTFAAFLVAVVCLYYLSPLPRRRVVLLIASYAFYCTWSVPFAALLLAMTWVAFRLGLRMDAAGNDDVRWADLRVGLVLLLLPLLAFKYLGGTASARVWFGGTSVGAALLAGFAGAVGISYYTLKLVSYVVDVYWERQPVCSDFIGLATYAAYFPQILSGPIQRAGDFLAQIETPTQPRPRLVISGLQLILFGLFKKLVLADRLGVVVDQVYGDPGAFSGAVVLVSAYLFAIQLYADFSGVTDIAIGVGRLFGLRAPPNFDSPFYAENMQEFWRRWHMTLTGWLRDYVFMPLRMSLRGWGETGAMLSIAINMTAIGVWHGPRLTFLAFGIINAIYLMISTRTLKERTKWLRERPLLQRLHAWTGPLITFNLVVASFVFFRAESLAQAFHVFRQSFSAFLAPLGLANAAGQAGFGALAWGPADLGLVVWALLVMETVHYLQHRRSLKPLVNAMPGWARWAAYCSLGFAVLLWGDTGAKQFIYVRF